MLRQQSGQHCGRRTEQQHAGQVSGTRRARALSCNRASVARSRPPRAQWRTSDVECAALQQDCDVTAGEDGERGSGEPSQPPESDQAGKMSVVGVQETQHTDIVNFQDVSIQYRSLSPQTWQTRTQNSRAGLMLNLGKLLLQQTGSLQDTFPHHKHFGFIDWIPRQRKLQQCLFGNRCSPVVQDELYSLVIGTLLVWVAPSI